MKRKNKKTVHWIEKTVQWGRVFEFHFTGQIKKRFQRGRVKYALVTVLNDNWKYDLEIRSSQLRKKCKCGNC